MFVFAGGGTGGHVFPLLAVAEELRGRGRQCLFIGTRGGIEARLVPASGFEIEFIEIGGLKGVGARRMLTTLWQIPASSYGAIEILRRRAVSAVFSMGGYVAGPAVIAALLLGIPIVAMEPNVAPGFTNRRAGRIAAKTLLAFPETARHFPRRRTEVTGLPVREEFFEIPPKAPGDRLNLLITGGSRGSRTLNEASWGSWPLFREARIPVRIVHQSGRDEFERLQGEFAQSGIEGEVRPFIDDMPAAFAQADLIVCRSGAGAVAELAASGKPGILVPFPYAADQHQLRNAEAFERAGAAVLALDREMNGQTLFNLVTAIGGEPGRLERMGQASRGLARRGAAKRAADILEELAGREKV